MFATASPWSHLRRHLACPFLSHPTEHQREQPSLSPVPQEESDNIRHGRAYRPSRAVADEAVLHTTPHVDPCALSVSGNARKGRARLAVTMRSSVPLNRPSGGSACDADPVYM